ncbi:MAG TPA: hypothetical protein VG798_08630 [Rhizomicrobium sp.]|nr:hypothetical protein [Rhizomicrobium sp.]
MTPNKSALPALLLLEGQLSFRARAGHLALLLAAAGMSAVIAALLATETGLPQRTVVAFGVLLIIGASWVGYAAWVLAARRTLLANHRVIAGRIAVAAASVFLAGSVAVGITTQAPSAYAAGGLGAIMLAIAVALLLRASSNYRALLQRRSELEGQLRQSR